MPDEFAPVMTPLGSGFYDMNFDAMDRRREIRKVLDFGLSFHGIRYLSKGQQQEWKFPHLDPLRMAATICNMPGCGRMLRPGQHLVCPEHE